MTEELSRLTRLRATIRGQITKLDQHLQQLQNVSDFEISQRLVSLDNYEIKFDKVQTEIEALAENFETEIEQRHTTEESILQLKLKLHALRPAPAADAPSTYVSASQHTRSYEGTRENTPVVTHRPKLTFQPFQESENFTYFVKRLETYMKLSDCEDPRTQTLMLLSSIPPDLHQKAYDLCAPDDPTELDFNHVVKTLKEYLEPKPSVWACQHKFITRIQETHETIIAYTSELKRLCQDCVFSCSHCKKSISDNFLTLQFIRGIRDRDIRTQILQESKVTSFTDVVKTATTLELAKTDSNYMSPGHCSSQDQHAVQTESNNKFRAGNKPLSIRDLKGKCFRCGSHEHQANKCRSINDTCNKCNRKGHLARVCLRNSQMNKQVEPEPDHMQEPYSDDSSDVVDDNTPWDMNLIRSRNTDKFMIHVAINNRNALMEVDTGAALSSMSHTEFKKLNTGCKIYKTNITMRTYTGEIFTPLGVTYVTCKYKNQTFDGKLYIIKQDVDAIFGRTWIRSINLDLASINQVNSKVHPDLDKLFTEFADVFDGTLGCIPNYKGRFTLGDNAIPIFVKPRRIPYALKDKVDDEIERLCKQGVLTKVDNSEWGTPVVPIVKPNGTIRLCADYKVTLNKAIRDEQYPIPIIEDILVEMNGGEFFCTLDLSQAYLHMVMDDACAMMQTLNTHKGTFKVNRLMFGIKVAPNLWQKFMDQLLQGIAGVKCFFDDIIIQGTSEKQLLTRLRQVLQKLQENNLRLNKEKCCFMKENIEYLGHIIDKNGLHKNKKKVKAITETVPPSNVNELRTFLGMANYYNKFIPNLASISSPLNNLLKKGIHYQWTKKCDESFRRIKEEILSDRVLTHFSLDKPIVLATDASPTGLGAVLSHRLPDGSDRPIAFASRSLTSSEKKYSQIDKEATSLFWGLKKFFHYCYGRKFILVTDHKPLTTIFHPHKTLPAMSTMRLFHYAHFLSGFNYTIEYRTSNDYLSRFPVDTIAPNIIDVHTAFQLNQMNTISIDRLKIAEETQKDVEFNKLLQTLMTGGTVTRYGYNDNELTIQDGCLLKGTRVMVPETLRKHVLDELHSGHLGMLKMKLLARGYVYWKNMDKEIEELVRGCRECRLHQNEPPHVTLHHCEPPTGPWQRLHIDFAGPLKGHSLFIIVDAYSKWVEILPTTSKTSIWCIKKLQELFLTFGFPLTLVSDNGRQFVSAEFETYLKNRGIVHKTSAPYHPATNGQAERYVQTIKKTLKRIDAQPGNLQEKLLAIKERLLRTPSATTGKSPYELMFNRTIRNALHVQFKARPGEARPETTQDVRESPSSVRTFTVGQRVQARSYKNGQDKWEFATVIRILGRLHYEIETDSGEMWKRHIDQMLGTKIPRD